MKQLFVFLFTCLVGTALCQLQCQPKNFKGFALDIINFQPTYSYHDVDNGLTLYQNLLDDVSQLYDFNTGTLYVQQNDGTCFRYQNNDAQLNQDPATLLQNIRQVFTYFEKEDQVHRIGLQVSNGAFDVRNIMTEKCDSVYTAFTVDGVLRVSNVFGLHEDLTQADSDMIRETLEAFEAASCELRLID